MMSKLNSNSIIETCELPKDVLLGASILSLTGNDELVIENFKNMIEYQEENLLIQCKKYKIRIEGKKLHIELFTKEEMKIKGKIESIKFI